MSHAAPSLLRRAGGWAVNLALVATTLACLAWLAPSLLGLERYVITGGSMSGSIEKGSLAFERAVPVDDLQVGDVITYQPPPGSGTTDLVTHRITRITSDDQGRQVLRTKGDANATVDPWRFSLTSGTQPVVQFTVPYVGHVLIALADRDTRMLLIGGPALLVALLALGELVRNLGRREPSAPEGHDQTSGAVPEQRRSRPATPQATTTPV